jgi:hypothetical protein
VDGEWPGVFVRSRRWRSARVERFGVTPGVPAVFSRDHVSQQWERVLGCGCELACDLHTSLVLSGASGDGSIVIWEGRVRTGRFPCEVGDQQMG